MGLNTTHDAWDGSYSSFGLWRKWIAKQIGIDLDSMIGFGGTNGWDESIPLYPLLNHSDCDGEISSEDCKIIADALRAILDKDPPDDPETDPDGYNIRKTEQFITGCISAWQKKENLEFH